MQTWNSGEWIQNPCNGAAETRGTLELPGHLVLPNYWGLGSLGDSVSKKQGIEQLRKTTTIILWLLLVYTHTHIVLILTGQKGVLVNVIVHLCRKSLQVSSEAKPKLTKKKILFNPCKLCIKRKRLTQCRHSTLEQLMLYSSGSQPFGA